MLNSLNRFLDRYVLMWPVKFVTHRFVILLTIGLLIPLLIFSFNSVFVMTVNSYLNTMSLAVSSIVLLYATVAEVRQKETEDRQRLHAEKIAALHESRDADDHKHLVEMHKMLMEELTGIRKLLKNDGDGKN
ncbi:MAG: hypothetical protein Q8N98_02020 [bacterium]|nr:hypothetical protein [bacterium]